MSEGSICSTARNANIRFMWDSRHIIQFNSNLLNKSVASTAWFVLPVQIFSPTIGCQQSKSHYIHPNQSTEFIHLKHHKMEKHNRDQVLIYFINHLERKSYSFKQFCDKAYIKGSNELAFGSEGKKQRRDAQHRIQQLRICLNRRTVEQSEDFVFTVSLQTFIDLVFIVSFNWLSLSLGYHWS